MLDTQKWANIHCQKTPIMQEDYRDFQHKKCKAVLVIKTGRDREEVEYEILGPEAETTRRLRFPYLPLAGSKQI